MQKPRPSSCHLYAGGRLGSKQVSPELILETCKHPSFDAVPDISTPHQWFAYAHLLDPHLTRSSAMPFPQRSPQWLFTNAAWGGLKPAPESRLRGAYPHLLCSYARFIKSALVAHLHISYFLQNCKKGKKKKRICLSDIRKHNLTVFSKGKDILQWAKD